MRGGSSSVGELVTTNSEADAMGFCFCWMDCAFFFPYVIFLWARTDEQGMKKIVLVPFG